MRLVDADKLKEVIDSWIGDIKCSDDDDVANAEGQALYCVLCLIDDQETAYDVDKVLNDITERRLKMFNMNFPNSLINECGYFQRMVVEGGIAGEVAQSNRRNRKQSGERGGADE